MYWTNSGVTIFEVYLQKIFKSCQKKPDLQLFDNRPPEIFINASFPQLLSSED